MLSAQPIPPCEAHEELTERLREDYPWLADEEPQAYGPSALIRRVGHELWLRSRRIAPYRNEPNVYHELLEGGATQREPCGPKLYGRGNIPEEWTQRLRTIRRLARGQAELAGETAAETDGRLQKMEAGW